jgi:hypothetical protein
MKNGIKNFGYIVLILIIVAFGKVLGKFLVNGVWGSSNKLTYNDSLKIYLNTFHSIEDSINKNPKILDEYTSLDSINCSSEENTITYYHTLYQNTKSDFDSTIFNSMMKSQIDTALLNNPKMFMQRRFKTKLKYVYYDKYGEFVSKIEAIN